MWNGPSAVCDTLRREHLATSLRRPRVGREEYKDGNPALQGERDWSLMKSGSREDQGGTVEKGTPCTREKEDSVKDAKGEKIKVRENRKSDAKENKQAAIHMALHRGMNMVRHWWNVNKKKVWWVWNAVKRDAADHEKPLHDVLSNFLNFLSIMRLHERFLKEEKGGNTQAPGPFYSAGWGSNPSDDYCFVLFWGNFSMSLNLFSNVIQKD